MPSLMSEPGLIIRILGVEAGDVSLTSNMPKFVRIIAETVTGPLDVRLSESAARELAVEGRYLRSPGSR